MKKHKENTEQKAPKKESKYDITVKLNTTFEQAVKMMINEPKHQKRKAD